MTVETPSPAVVLEPNAPDYSAIELRLTARCCRQDLNVEPAEADIRQLAESTLIVRKFIELRSVLPDEAQETFASTSRSDIYTLHAGQMRGATWCDREYGVVWLLGFGLHREGHRSDAYNVLAELDRRGQLLPSAEDYEMMMREREARQLPAIVAEMRALLKRARGTPEKVHSVLLSVGVRVSLFIVREGDDTEGLEEFHLAVSARHLEEGWLAIIRTAIWPSENQDAWEYTREFPEREPSKDELRFKHWHEMGTPSPHA
jgi:hypothetical protein